MHCQKKTKLFISDKSYLIPDHEYVEVDYKMPGSASTYLLCIEGLSSALQHNIKNITIVSFSRLIDELKGLIAPVHTDLFQVITRNVLPYFVDIDFVKLSEEDLNSQMKKEKSCLEHTS